jgi:hypothetical protein
VTPDKLAAWLKEDILLRRVKRRCRRARARPVAAAAAAAVVVKDPEATALQEVKSLAAALEVPITDAVALLADDREDYVPPAALDLGGDSGGAAGSLLTKGTLDAYIAAVIELWRLQVAHGSRNTENPRGAAVRGFLE